MDELARKKRSKKNSMDINGSSKPSQLDCFQKNKQQKSLMQTQILKKESVKKKRSNSKYEGETFRRTLGEGTSKSAAI